MTPNTDTGMRSLSAEEIQDVAGAVYNQLFKVSVGDWSLVVFTDDGHLGAGLEHRVGNKTYTKTGTL